MSNGGGYDPKNYDAAIDGEENPKKERLKHPDRAGIHNETPSLDGVRPDEFFSREDVKKGYYDVAKADDSPPSSDEVVKEIQRENRRAEIERRAQFPARGEMDVNDLTLPGEEPLSPIEGLHIELRELNERFEAASANRALSTISKGAGDGDLDPLRALLEALRHPDAENLLRNLEVEFVSGVSDPAQDSEWVIAKDVDGGAGWQVRTPLVLKADGDGDERKAFAPVLIPGEADRHGDVIPVEEIERAAHGYLSDYRQVDTDHSMLDGDGVPVESWTLKAPQSFERSDGSTTREYPVGTWMMGVEFAPEAWERVKSGDLTGFSIQGSATDVPAAEALAELDEANPEAVAKEFIAKSSERALDSLEETMNQLESYAESEGIALE